jgi:hypothetical protein
MDFVSEIEMWFHGMTDNAHDIPFFEPIQQDSIETSFNLESSIFSIYDLSLGSFFQ